VQRWDVLSPATPLTADTYSYATNKVYYSRDVAGVHLVFVNMWPDSAARAWLDADLAMVGTTTPVVLFTHDQPESEAKHFTNPNGTHGINSTDKFENLLVDQLDPVLEGTTTAALNYVQQQKLADWASRHPNLVAYLHGNDNQNEFYVWTGKNGTTPLDLGVAFNTFRVDSPMKGNLSATDETLLSFQLFTVDSCSMQLTAREFRWNRARSPT
jgi:hypothetical protein